jgi:hypothetical protein
VSDSGERERNERRRRADAVARVAKQLICDERDPSWSS